MELNDLSADQLMDLAQSGDSAAQCQLGGQFYSGSGVKQDFTVAAQWFEKSSLQGHARAQLYLGYMYEFGEGLDLDLVTAMKWYIRAAKQGLPEAQRNLGNLYERNQEFNEAAHWYRCAADQGLASAQASLGYALSKGLGVPVDEAGAFNYYLMAAEQGYAAAQFNLGGMYAEGRGTPADPRAAAHWVRLAADQGYGGALGVLGDFYVQGFGVSQNCLEAIKWYLCGALQDRPDAQTSLAIHYATGNGVAEDQVRAFMWFSAAAKGGSPDAIHNRERVPLDRNTDIYKLISAAAAGEVEAQRDLAIRLHEGHGIAQDDDASHYWIHKAAEAGDAWAQTTYALQLRPNDDPDVQKEKIKWFSRAGEQGDARALFNLGLRQFLGEGTAANPESAGVNMLKASLAGFEGAREAFETLKKITSDEQCAVIIERVEWPDLMFVLGPMAEGHMDVSRFLQDNDDGSEDAEWLRYERDAANAMFLGSKNQKGSILDSVFGEKVTVEQIYVGRSYFDGKIHVGVTINQRDIKLASGFPVYWQPLAEELNAAASLIGLIGARTWVRVNYLTF